MIFIRTDANRHIATGHLMRTLSIARECVCKGVPICFIVSDTGSATLLKKQLKEIENFKIIVLSSLCSNPISYENPEEELELMESIFIAEKPDCLLIDSYYVTEKYLIELGTYTRIAYIDDIMAFDYPVDILINYDVIQEDSLQRYEDAYQKAKYTFLGASFAPLRKQFEKVSYQVKKEVSDILITTGGADEQNITGKLLEELIWNHHIFTYVEKEDKNKDKVNYPEPNIKYHVVVGPLNKNKWELQAFADIHSNVILHENIFDMAGLMQACDMAISAAGTTLYELCAVGVPSISFVMADNQIPSAQAFAKSGAVLYAGDARNNDYFIKELAAMFDEFRLDVTQRVQRSAIMRSLIDGKGTARIVEQLIKPG